MKDLLLHKWHLKLISLALATALWAQVARTPTSETGVSVLLEYQNIPPKTEVYGDTINRAEVRLRGPSSLLRSVSAQDVSLSIDMRSMAMGQEKILPLTPDLVHAPFGV
jgi:YbbR domain-containing protein